MSLRVGCSSFRNKACHFGILPQEWQAAASLNLIYLVKRLRAVICSRWPHGRETAGPGSMTLPYSLPQKGKQLSIKAPIQIVPRLGPRSGVTPLGVHWDGAV